MTIGHVTIPLGPEIARLYEVFGRYKAPQKGTFCKHCVSDAEDLILRSKPLKELTAEELARYSWKAVSTWGTPEQFKYTLPRLFEVVVSEPLRYDPEVLFKKPRVAGLSDWPEDEREALLSFCRALWRYALSHAPVSERLPSFPSIDDCLCSIGQIADDLMPFLSEWDVDKSSAATSNLVEFAEENLSAIREGRTLSNSFWDGRKGQMQQVSDWFLAHDFAIVFDVAVQSVSNAELRDDLERAIRKRMNS